MRRRRIDRVRSGALVALAATAALALAGPAAAKSGPTTTTTPPTPTTTPPGTEYITFSGNGGFSIGGPGIAGSGFASSASGFGAPASVRRVGRRTTAGGVQLRVYAGAFSFGPLVGLPPFFPSASCLPDQSLVADASTDAVAGTTNFYARTGQPPTPQGGYLGLTENAPVAVVATKVPNGTRAAVMRFAGGPTDRAAPLAGDWVVLAARVPAPPATHRPVPLLTDTTPSLGTLSTVDRSGHTHDFGTVRAGLGFPIASSCLSTPGRGSNSQEIITGVTGGGTLGPSPATLPPATGPPPTDPAAARRAIEAAYRGVFQAKAKPNNPYLQGAPVLTPAELRQLQAGYGDILGKLVVRINDFRFLSPTEAALSFDLLLNGQPVTASTVGRAVLVKGRWKVTRATFCTVISRANVGCG